MKKEIKQKALDYLKSQFETIENIPDVKDMQYNAKPLFSENDIPVKSIFSQEATFPNFVLTYRSFSPTNHTGKLKEGYYVIIYHVEPLNN